MRVLKLSLPLIGRYSKTYDAQNGNRVEALGISTEPQMYFDPSALGLTAKCDETILNETKTHAFNCWTRSCDRQSQ